MSSKLTPTPEQANVINLAAKGESMAVEAVAGAGKTTTLMLAANEIHGRGVFTAFNRAIVNDVKGKAPSNTTANTIHSLAMRGTNREYAHRLGSHRMRSSELAKRYGVTGQKVSTKKGTKWLTAGFLAGMVTKTLRQFCQTAEPHIADWMMPTPRIVRDDPDLVEMYDQFRPDVVRAAQKAWDTDLSKTDGTIPYDHGYYLKAWQLSGPDIDADFLMVDEAQDLSGIMIGIMEHNRDRGTQIIAVGDPNQQIYGWNGAVDALAKLEFDHRSKLTHSFRFGPEIAGVANSILDKLTTDIRVVGAGKPGIVAPIEEPRMYLSRTNVSTVRQAIREAVDGRSAHIVGGAEDIVSFCRAVIELKAGRRVMHPELSWADDWNEVVAYANQDELGGDLKLFVDLVTEFGEQKLIDLMKNQPRIQDADVVLSTAHKAKGLEHRRVRLLGDFSPDPMPEERRLLYVAVTRAQHQLDIEPVSYLRETHKPKKQLTGPPKALPAGDPA